MTSPGCTLKASRPDISEFKCSVNSFGQHHRLTAVEQEKLSCSSAMNIQQDTSSSLDQQRIRWNSRRGTSLSNQWTHQILLRETRFSLASLSNSSTPTLTFHWTSIEVTTRWRSETFPKNSVTLTGPSSPLEAKHFSSHYATKMRRVQLDNDSINSARRSNWGLTTISAGWSDGHAFGSEHLHGRSSSSLRHFVSSDQWDSHTHQSGLLQRRIGRQSRPDATSQTNGDQGIKKVRSPFLPRLNWSRENVSQHEIILWEHLPMESALSSSSFFLRAAIEEFRTTFVCQMTCQKCDLDLKLISDLFADLCFNTHRVQVLSHR